VALAACPQIEIQVPAFQVIAHAGAEHAHPRRLTENFADGTDDRFDLGLGQTHGCTGISVAERDHSQHNMSDFPMIGSIWHRDGQRPAERWHTDHTNRQRPPPATILYGVEIPSAGDDTSGANMRATYVALPEDERRRLESLSVEL
jgi:alpha-ketoglutarate-dependent taurine dioxygenase